ncbi:MAG: hypothetical protein KatS3mg039_0329 [Candidatus Kapaibacterium sp.]|nr:MAG: hypothetical protein KatS3mg039_0329 [Candidatus Kapabacteria bacterium]
MNPMQLHRLVLGYAAVLLVAGLVVYGVGERHSPIALLGGVGGSVMVAVLSFLWRRRVLWSRPALTTAVGIFALSFLWRSVEAWVQTEMLAGIVLSVLAVLSLPLFVVLLRWWNR